MNYQHCESINKQKKLNYNNKLTCLNLHNTDYKFLMKYLYVDFYWRTRIFFRFT